MPALRLLVRLCAVVAAFALFLGGEVRLDAAPAVIAAAIDPANRDATCPACRDFYQFANGGWLKSHPIPGDKATWSHWDQLDEDNLAALRRGLETAAASHAAPGSRDQKLGDFYAACTDEDTIEQKGAAPLQDGLARIDAVNDVPALLALVADFHRRGAAGPFFGYGSQPDPVNSSRTIGDLSQGGLSLPERDYYTRTDAKSEQFRQDFAAHVARELQLVGEDASAASTDAQTVLRVESALAIAQTPKAQLRDPKVTTNPYTVAKLASLGTAIDWRAYLRTVGSSTGALNVDEPAYFRALEKMLATTPLADLKTYLRWQYVGANAGLLSKAFVDENFSWQQKVFGTKAQPPRWKRCIRVVDGSMDELLGQMFVAMRFPPSAKAHAEQMVGNLRSAYRADIAGLGWMTPATKARATEKLAAIVQKIGYPARWRDYSALIVARDDYFGDVQRAREFASRRDIAKIGKPTDRTEWAMPPQLINAQYEPTLNDITFPAAILLPPFFDEHNDDALNYGAIGAVIGHEMTHGFDDNGRLYDKVGNLRNWWSPADNRQFNARVACVTKQYGKMEAAPGVLQNGPLVTGEALADLGGLRIAYNAYEKSLAGKPRRTINGYTPEQRFFLAFATVWAENDTPEFARFLGQSNEHPVNRNRVIGTLENMPEFARAFGCKAGDPMVKPAAAMCKVW
ncbi:MAG TPA: M13 family metallopeptidase [Candidatus Limnocylindrales bacterium]|nr:M13 family metallopeptidase [Candidatus Limnocylindrales bacterium]